MNEDPVLSVCIICYNQRQFIRQAIESVLSQKFYQSWEIIVADDFSTDGTKEILKEYKLKFPALIKILPREKNVGPAINFAELLAAARGKYIAYLEGDDFWFDDNKLLDQVNHLESNPHLVACFCNVLEIFSEDLESSENYLQNGCFPAIEISTNQWVYKNWFQTCSWVFRNFKVRPVPDWINKLKVGDWPMHVLLSTFGNAGYIHKTMAVHRNHSSGTWSVKTKLARIEAILEAYDAIAKNTTIGKLKDFKKAKSNVMLSAVKYSFREFTIVKAVRFFFLGVLLYPKNLFEKKIPY
jgi:glycosyltransferase involved in cell wall biosynthesis